MMGTPQTPQLTTRRGHRTQEEVQTEPGSHAMEKGRQSSELGEAKVATICRAKQKKRKRREPERAGIPCVFEQTGKIC